MKKVLLATTVVILVGAGGSAWFVYHNRDPLIEAKALINKGDYRGAGLQLRTAARDEPNNAEAHALLAQLQLASDDPIAAEREIKRAIALHWDPETSMEVLSQSYLRQKKWKEILAEMPDHGATPDQTAYFLMTRAVAQHGLGDKGAAMAALSDAKRIAPKNAELFLTGARLAVEDGNIPVALAEVDQAMALDPQRVDAMQLKASLLASKGDRDQALAEFTTAVQAAPDRNDILTQRAGLLLMMNQDQKAAADIDTLLSRQQTNPVARYMKVVLLARQRKFAEADPLVTQIDTVLPQLPRGLYFKAMVKSEMGQTAQAEDAITTYVNRFPGDLDGVRLLGAIELQSKHPERAIPYLAKAVEAGQRDPDTLDLLGRAYAMAGNQADAERVLQQAAAVSRTPQQLTRLASARLQVGDLNGAAFDLRRSIEAAPAQVGAAETLIATSIRLGQLDRAQEDLAKLQQQTGDTETVGNLTGLLAIARLDPEAALTAFTDTAKKFPDSRVARLNEARVLLQLNRASDAIPVLKEVLDKDPAQADALTLLVQTLLAQGRGPEAVEYAEKARKAQPNDLGVVNGEAQLYGRLNQFDKGIQVIEAARKDGKIPSVLLATLGSLQFAAGQTDGAKQSFADLIAAEPANLPAVLSDVDLLTRLKDTEGARRVLDDAIRNQPGKLPLLQARVRLDLLDKGVDNALQTADRLRNDAVNMPAAATLKGGVLMGARRYADAAKEFAGEYAKDPSTALVLALAEAKQAAGDAGGALNDLTGFQAKHPDDAAVAQTLGALEITSHQYDAAERNLQIVLKQQPNNVPALNNLAWIYQQKGDKRAREVAQRAFEQNPAPEVADTLGWIMTSQGDAPKAVSLLERASAAAPQNPTIRYHLAVALKDVGRRADALATLKPIIDGSAAFDEKSQAQSLYAELNTPKP